MTDNRERNTKAAIGTYVDIWQEYALHTYNILVTFPEYMDYEEVEQSGICDLIRSWYIAFMDSEDKPCHAALKDHIEKCLIENDIDYSGIFVQEYLAGAGKRQL